MSKTEKHSGIEPVSGKSLGGAREGAGRPSGTTNKIPTKTLLEEFSAVNGTTVAHELALLWQDMNTPKDKISYLSRFGKYFLQEQPKAVQHEVSNTTPLLSIKVDKE